MRLAVIPTHDRPGDYEDCYAAIRPQVDMVITIAHFATYAKAPSISYTEVVPNISVMWNLGLDEAEWQAGKEPFDVAVLNDDAIVPPDWFDRVTSHMRILGAAAGCVHRPHDPRMAGHAFILDGSKGLRADPQFQWWYGDDDLERRAGEIAFVRGPGVEHRHPNSTTVGELAWIAGQDKIRFQKKWGSR